MSIYRIIITNLHIKLLLIISGTCDRIFSSNVKMWFQNKHFKYKKIMKHGSGSVGEHLHCTSCAPLKHHLKLYVLEEKNVQSSVI